VSLRCFLILCAHITLRFPASKGWTISFYGPVSEGGKVIAYVVSCPVQDAASSCC
jgi:hypothetical protein